MNCPKCKNEKTQVIDSRDCDTRTIRRRRECEDCNFRFTTYERIEQSKIVVVKRNGKTEPFEREKIIKGMRIASNEKIDDAIISDTADEIEQRLIDLAENQINTKRIGQLVATKLKKIDEVAYLRFVSVYKGFDDISSFEQELIKLKK